MDSPRGGGAVVMSQMCIKILLIGIIESIALKLILIHTIMSRLVLLMIILVITVSNEVNLKRRNNASQVLKTYASLLHYLHNLFECRNSFGVLVGTVVYLFILSQVLTKIRK